MLFPIESAHWIPRSLAILAFAFSATAASAAPADFEIGEGYLSASVRDLVETHDWSLVWNANEDRLVSHPFTIENSSLRGALESLLSMYRGQFVADLYRGNRVVVVNTPPPRVGVEVPGAESADLAQRSTAAEPFPAGPDVDGTGGNPATESPVVVAYEVTGPSETDGLTTPLQSSGNEEESSGSR